MQATIPANDNDDFETLLNLLASDAANEPVADPNHHEFKSRENEQDGKLDLKKIRSFYQERNVGDPVQGYSPATEQSGTIESFSRSLPEIDESHALEEEQSTLGTRKESVDEPLPSDFVQRRSIASLTEAEAKGMLAGISSALGLSESALCTEKDLSLGSTSGPIVYRPSTIPEVRRALDFVIQMDELVRRRSQYGAPASVFDADNIDSLVDHIKLWERVSRSYTP